MVNAFLNYGKAKQVLEVRKLTPKLIFFVKFDRFAILLLILPSTIPLLPFITSSFSLILI